MTEIIQNNISKIAQQAQIAMLYEVVCQPKPGLVDPVDNGSHSDMDVFTFMESSTVLLPYFESFIQAGFESRKHEVKETFRRIRLIGVEAEEAMFQVTNGVNTHKGAIFSLGIFLSVCGRLVIWENEITCEELQAEIKILTADLLTDFDAIEVDSKRLTYGEYLFLTYGITGIRGEAKAGYPSIFNKGLPFYEESKQMQQGKLIDTLLYLSLFIEDTNLMKRSQNPEIRQTYSEIIKPYFEKGGYGSIEGKEYLKTLNILFKEKNWSIGGSADALILVIFIAKLKNLTYVV